MQGRTIPKAKQEAETRKTRELTQRENGGRQQQWNTGDTKKYKDKKNITSKNKNAEPEHVQ